MDQVQPKHHGFPAFFVAGSYAILCALVIGAVRLAAGRPVDSLPNPGGALLPWQAIAFIVAALLIGALIIRKVHVRTAWELILGVTLFLGVWFYLWVAFSGEIGLLVASAMTLIQAWVRRVWVHDVFILVGTAGVALNFAFLFPTHTLFILLVAFAVYDTFAGRPGGLAARFAASLVHRGVVPGLIVPGRGRDVGAAVNDAVRRDDSIFLGAGDLILPLMLVARAAPAGMMVTAAVSAGTLIAAAWLGSRGATKPFPALVPLAAGAGIPYLILMLTHAV